MVSPVSQTFATFVFCSDYYKRTAGIPFMDSFLQELNNRFSADNRALKSIMSLVPLVMVRLEDAQSLAKDLLFWEKDLCFPLALTVRYDTSHLRVKRVWILYSIMYIVYLST